MKLNRTPLPNRIAHTTCTGRHYAARVAFFILSVFILQIILSHPLFAQTTHTHPAPGLGSYDIPFYPDGTYRPDVQSPEAFLGFKIGSRPIRYDEVLRYFSYLDETLPNATLRGYGESFEGRKLVYLTVTSEENAMNLSVIKERIAKLADPRLLKNETEAKNIIRQTPAVAWMAYSIHGDELSSTDAAVQLVYQLLAGTDETSQKIRDNTIVCIDPLQNPDGRMRWIGQLEQWHGAVPSTDTQSLHHRGFWTRGRGNHYLFDLNRDWFTLVHPETRSKVQVILEWNPQFAVDCHEMGQMATYLFSPPREPFNPFMISQIHKWWDIVAKDQGAAFDRYGWSYYTREWNEELYPGYGSSWSIYIGAVGMLYEQARADGSLVKRRDGKIMTFRETIHHQFVSSMANITTVASNRERLLEDYFAEKKRAVGGAIGKRDKSSGKTAAFFFPPDSNKSRLDRFARTLDLQRIEVSVAESSFRVSRAVSSKGEEKRNLELPRGTLVVPLNQPLRHLIETILTFDIRLNTRFLEIEKKEILKRNETKLYEVTGWSLPLAYNLDAYFTENLPRLKMEPFESSPPLGAIEGEPPVYGYILDSTDDRSYRALARLLDRGYRVWCGKEPFEVEGKSYPRGSFLLRLESNPSLKAEDLEEIASAEGVVFHAVSTALAATGADLGGNEFVLLEAPRIGIFGGSNIGTTSFGAVWHLLDIGLSLRSSLLDVSTFSRMDLDKYNVLILPSVSYESGSFKNSLGKEGVEKLKKWVTDGGTLIATGTGAAFLADTSIAISSVRQKRQVLKDFSSYEASLDAVKEAEAPIVDSLDVWEAKVPETAKSKTKEDETKNDLDALKRADKKARILFPHGAILATDIDDEHWLSFGCKPTVPVMVYTSYAYLAKDPAEVAARFSTEERLRLSGLLWPEARTRWSETAYATREALGRGQVILFATLPNFRGYFHGGERMLLNAMMLGPGFGTKRSVEW